MGRSGIRLGCAVAGGGPGGPSLAERRGIGVGVWFLVPSEGARGELAEARFVYAQRVVGRAR